MACCMSQLRFDFRNCDLAFGQRVLGACELIASGHQCSRATMGTDAAQPFFLHSTCSDGYSKMQDETADAGLVSRLGRDNFGSNFQSHHSYPLMSLGL